MGSRHGHMGSLQLRLDGPQIGDIDDDGVANYDVVDGM